MTCTVNIVLHVFSGSIYVEAGEEGVCPHEEPKRAQRVKTQAEKAAQRTGTVENPWACVEASGTSRYVAPTALALSPSDLEARRLLDCRSAGITRCLRRVGRVVHRIVCRRRNENNEVETSVAGACRQLLSTRCRVEERCMKYREELCYIAGNN